MAARDDALLGLDQFLALSKALKNAGHKELRAKLHTAMKAPVREVIPATRAEARRTLPTRGGLAAKVAKAPQRVQVLTGKDPGVKLVVGNNKSAARALNTGPTFRHPVFATDTDRRNWSWVAQPVRTTDWFDRPAKAALPGVQDAVLHALDTVAAEIAEEVGRGR